MDKRNDALKELGTFIVEQTLQDVGASKSPVTGRGFKKLSADYREAKNEFASPIPNLELTGAMLDSLDARMNKTGLEIGIFDYDEAQKADNHCKFSSASKETKVPKRPFVPNKKEGESYRPEIRREIIQILKENSKEGITKAQIEQALGELNGGR